MISLAIGGIGLSRSEFWRMTYREFLAASSGFFDKNVNDHKLAWEVARWQTYYLFNLNVDKKYKLKNINQLIRFPWEEAEKIVLPTQKQWEAALDRLGRRYSHN